MAKATAWIAFLAALACATLWLGFESAGQDAGLRLLAKAAVLPLLASAVAFGGDTVPARGWLIVALLLSGLGDVSIELDFLAGMAAFAVAHGVYVALFWPRRRDFECVTAADRLRLGLLGIAAALFLARLAPVLRGTLRVAVPAYAVALLAMAGSAQLVSRGRPWVPLGALLFVLSDGLLAVQRFAGDPIGRSWVWPLYVAAQALIVYGWTRAGTGASVDHDGAAAAH